jgi:hypothetical protein
LNNHAKTARVDVLKNGIIHWQAGGRDHGWISLTGIEFPVVNLKSAFEATPVYACDRAFKRVAMQSSSIGSASDAGRVLKPHDGCSSTKQEHNPWWRVDLGTAFAVDEVRIRGKGATAFRVQVSAHTHATGGMCDTSESKLSDQKGNDVPCNGQVGRYVTVSLKGTATLTLCSVEVFGKKTMRLSIQDRTRCVIPHR